MLGVWTVQCVHIIFYRCVKDLDIVIKELTSDQHLPSAVWRRLGLQLELYDDRLMNIDTDYRGQSVDCFHA